jgi:hypothetical protein
MGNHSTAYFGLHSGNHVYHHLLLILKTITMTDLFNELGDIHKKTYEDEIEMAAIWINYPIQTATIRTVRICNGLLVRVEDDRLVDCSEDAPATHEVTGCMGTIASNKLSMLLKDLSSNEYVTLKIK